MKIACGLPSIYIATNILLPKRKYNYMQANDLYKVKRLKFINAQIKILFLCVIMLSKLILIQYRLISL
jgi:hypothetical protein